MKIWKIRSKITGKFLIDSYGKFNKIGKTWNNKDGAVRFRENAWFDTRVGGPHRREDTEVVEYNMIEVSQRRTELMEKPELKSDDMSMLETIMHQLLKDYGNSTKPFDEGDALEDLQIELYDFFKVI